MSNQTSNSYERATRRDRNWWGFGTDAGGCIGCGPAWWAIAAVIVAIVFFWGWGWPGTGGWGGWGWRGTSNCTQTTGYTQPAPHENASGRAATPPAQNNNNHGDAGNATPPP